MERFCESIRKLVLLYEKFYNENPNFSRDDVRRKAMAMVYLLGEYSVYLPISTSFRLSEKNSSKVWSSDVQRLFSKCSVLSVEYYQLILEKGKDWSILFAQLIGRIVSRFSSFDGVMFMENVATILFLRKYSFVNASIDEIVHSKYVTCYYEDVSVIMELLDYLEVLRDYVCGIGSIGKDGVVKNTELERDSFINNFELALKRNKEKEERNLC